MKKDDTKAQVFYAKAPDNFRECMIRYWMYNENVNRARALGFYADNSFDILCERLAGYERGFKLDINPYQEDTNPTCFELEDNNFVIPVDILTITKGEA